MPIAALSQGDIRALGSSQVLATPVSLIKELVENALDAQSSTIAVEISTNSIDFVQVKDNGHGIAPEDRDNVARRYFTSKIRDVAELKLLGGRSLGFRGEALASAAEMSGGLDIVTRIEGEVTATKMAIGREGQVLSYERASHAVGTTVKVTRFLQHFPVRKEVALKYAPRTLLGIKEMLQSYAMARPTVRLSIKVLKAKNEKGNWTYAPRKDATVAEAALSVLGKDTVAQCTFMSSDSDSQSGAGDLPGQDGQGYPTSTVGRFRFQAFLPRPCAEPSKVSNKAHFISIDSRPVSCGRGTLRQILGLYKDHIRSALSDVSGVNLRDPFICMNIICLQASYDVNIEPTKDDVLFEDPSSLLDEIESFFSGIYGPIRNGNPKTRVEKLGGAPRTNAFALLLARKSPEACSSKNRHQRASDLFCDEGELSLERNDIGLSGSLETAVPETHPSIRPTSASLTYRGREPAADSQPCGAEHPNVQMQPRWRSNMYDDDDDEEGVNELLDSLLSRKTLPTSNSALTTEDAAVEQSLRPTPPMSSNELLYLQPTLTMLEDSRPHHEAGGSLILSTPQGIIEQQSLRPRAALEATTFPPSPCSPASPAPNLRLAKPLPFLGGSEGKCEETEGRSRTALQSYDELEKSEQTQFNTATHGIRVSPGPQSPARARDVGEGDRVQGFVTARSLALDNPSGQDELGPRRLGMTSPVSSRRRDDAPKSLPSLVQGIERTWYDVGGQERRKAHNRGRNRDIREALALSPSRQPIRNNVEPTTARGPAKSSDIVLLHPDVEDLLDYERRKKIATKRKRDMLSQNGDIANFLARRQIGKEDPLVPSASPHRNRYNAAVAALREPEQKEDSDLASCFPENDPRGYFILMTSNRTRDGEGLLRRSRLSMLPLEEIPVDDRLHNLSLTISTDYEQVRRRLSMASSIDCYVRDGALRTGISMKDELAEDITRNLSKLINSAYKCEGGGLPSLTLNLEASFREHLETLL